MPSASQELDRNRSVRMTRGSIGWRVDGALGNHGILFNYAQPPNWLYPHSSSTAPIL